MLEATGLKGLGRKVEICHQKFGTPKERTLKAISRSTAQLQERPKPFRDATTMELPQMAAGATPQLYETRRKSGCTEDGRVIEVELPRPFGAHTIMNACQY